jgi:hypothetical protein
MNRHELAIAKTVIYASLFDYPLTLLQLHGSLMGVSLTQEDILSVYHGSAALRSIIEYRDGFFFPAGSSWLVDERRRRESRSRDFLARHARTLRWICALPFTRMVALSGSIAHHNLEEGGDLDLFIVARGRHVWTVTVATIVLARLLGSRRVVCANFVMSDERLAIDQQDLFTANQAIHLKPLIGLEVMEGFIAANPFIRRIYPNQQAQRNADEMLAPSYGLLRVKRACELIGAIAGPAIETICRRAYGWHLRRRAASWRSPEQVTLGLDCVKLHTQSHRSAVLARFAERLDEALAQSDRAAIA